MSSEFPSGSTNYLSNFTYTGGNQVISNYNGQPITLNVEDCTGMNFNGEHFVFKSSSGTLTIENITDKVVDLRNNAGKEIVKAYISSNAGVIDGRGSNAYELIYGAPNGSDTIFVGDGGSGLWGGNGSFSDVLVGGAGFDTFLGGRYQGSDNFYNVSSSDVVDLMFTNLSDIVGAWESNGTIIFNFNTGDSLTIQSTDTLSAAINLADGSSWRYNHVTKGWQTA